MLGALKFRLSSSLVCSHYRVLVKCCKNCGLPIMVSVDSVLTHMDSKEQLKARKGGSDESAK